MKRNLILIATTAVTLCAIPTTHAQEGGDDPFSAGEGGAAAAPQHQGPRSLSARYEVFSLSRADAAKLMRTNPADDKLYEIMVKMVDEETAAQEVFSVVRCQSGQKVSSEAISEMIYPTQWEPAELPNTVGLQITPPPSGKETTSPPVPNTAALKNAPRLDQLPSIMTPATATTFETRNVGINLEIEAVQQPSGLIDLRIAPEHVHFVRRNLWGQGVSAVEMPEFETQRLSLATILRPGSPHLLGTLNPPASSEIHADPKRQVWFAFITMTPVN